MAAPLVVDQFDTSVLRTDVSVQAVQPIVDLPDVPVKPKFVYDASLWSTDDFDSQFDVLTEIGHGSFARVHMALDRSTGDMVALKISHDTWDKMYDETKCLFQQEVSILKACSECEFIVGFHGAWRVDGCVHIVMEYCSGGSIRAIMKALDIRLSGDQIALVCFDMLSALTFLHAKIGTKYIHRDVKADNIVLDARGFCKLADFGVSKIKLGTQVPASTLRRGSAHWMAPEMIPRFEYGDVEYDREADIWALGVTAIEMASGRPPYSDVPPHLQHYRGKDLSNAMGQRAMEIVASMNNPSPTIPEDVADEFGDGIKTFIAACLNKNHHERPTAIQLLEEDAWIIKAEKLSRSHLKRLVRSKITKSNEEKEEIIHVALAHNRKSSVRQVSQSPWTVPENADYEKALRMQQNLLKQRNDDEKELCSMHDTAKKELQSKLDACSVDNGKARCSKSILAPPVEADMQTLLDEMQDLLLQQKMEVLEVKRRYDRYERDMEMELHSRQCNESVEMPPCKSNSSKREQH